MHTEGVLSYRTALNCPGGKNGQLKPTIAVLRVWLCAFYIGLVKDIWTWDCNPVKRTPWKSDLNVIRALGKTETSWSRSQISTWAIFCAHHVHLYEHFAIDIIWKKIVLFHEDRHILLDVGMWRHYWQTILICHLWDYLRTDRVLLSLILRNAWLENCRRLQEDLRNWKACDLSFIGGVYQQDCGTVNQSV